MAYSDAQKASALAILDATREDGKPNYTEGARLTKIPASTLADWDKGRYVNSDVAEIREQKRGELADKLESLAHQLIDRASVLAPDATQLAQVMTGAGISIDKMRLLREQPTAITQNLTEAEIESELRELLDAARERASRIPTEASERKAG